MPGDWNSQADVLKQAMLPKVSQSECLEDNKDAGIPVTNEMFCTGHGGSSPISTCNTDSGGPSFAGIPMGDGIYRAWLAGGLGAAIRGITL